jgi:hypothetical protein
MSDDDKTLLENAAKAAGMTVTWDGDNPPYPRASSGNGWNPAWNPLASDGDAFRLAVKLCIPVVTWIREDGTDPCAATRRCIVRAAAAIGEAQ